MGKFMWQEVMNVSFYCFKKFKENIKNRKDKRIVYTVIAPKSNKKAYLPASATVEASIVIPLYVYAVLAVGYLIQIINIKSTMMQAMYNDVRQLAKYAYFCEGNSLPKDFSGQRNLVGKTAGISSYNSEIVMYNNEIYLKVSYTVKNPFDFFGIGKTKIQQQCVSGAWRGEDYVGNTGNKENNDAMVYITISGTVYHKEKTCSYLNPSIQSISVACIENQRNASGGKYYSCERCVRNTEPDIVYITDYGDRYHVDINCSGLKRSIFSVPLSKVSDKRACSKCGGNE